MTSILICHDRAPAVERLSTALEDRGYLAPVAHRQVDVVDLVKLHRPDLLLMGSRLADASGADALRAIRALAAGRELPAILLVGAHDELQREALGLDAVPYVDEGLADLDPLLELIAHRLEQGNRRVAVAADELDEAAEPESTVAVPRIVAPDLAALMSIGGWGLRKRIGRGGMGDVYLAEKDGRQAAIKVLPRHAELHEEARWRFEREIQALRRLRHPHIVEFLESGIANDRPYLVMRYVPAPNLRRYAELSGGTLSCADVVVLARQLACALASAAEAGVVHRDIKPTNILIDAPRPTMREPFCSVLCDFGLTRFADDPSGLRAAFQTGPLKAVGTPGYMSPEQVSGDGGTDLRQDIYGLGATLYCALTGSPPHVGGYGTRMRGTLRDDADLTPLIEKGLERSVVQVIAAMIARNPGRRPASWDAVIAELDEAAP